MRKLLLALLVAATTVIAVGFTAAPASALGSEQLGCYVTPSRTTPQLHTGFCQNNQAASSYQVRYGVLNESGTYSFAWSVPAPYNSNISYGCGTSDDYCVLAGLTPTSEFTVSVTITQDGQSVSRLVHTYVEPFCGNTFCG